MVKSSNTKERFLTHADFKVSSALEAFLAAEVRNEMDGGDSPTTLVTARDSLFQMGPDDLRSINAGTANASYDDLLSELTDLMDNFGYDFEVADKIDRNAGAQMVKPKSPSRQRA
jgi:hypothetical protein